MQKLEKEKTYELFQLKQNDMIMRQDLSTYQCYVEEAFGLSSRAQVMSFAIKSKLERIRDEEVKRSEDLIEDLEDLAEKMTKLSTEKALRKKHYREIIKTESFAAKLSGNLDVLPGMYEAKNNSKARF